MRKAALLASLCLAFAWGAFPAPTQILVPADAPPVVKFAAAEARRYVYVRTGKLLPVVEGEDARSDAIVVGSFLYVPALEPRHDIGETPGDAARLEQEYVIKTVPHRGHKLVVIAGSSDVATLYGVYRFAELLGVRFYLHGDVIPDEPMPLQFPEFDIEEIPLFATRGIQPFHDFPEGPDWWNRDDYKAVIGQLPKLRMNFIGLHTYPEERPNAEPTVWIGRPEDVNGDGTVKHGYPAIYYNTALPVGWGLSPKDTGAYPAGGAALFDRGDFGSDIMRGLTPRPETPEECTEVFNRTGAMFRDAFTFARFLGVKTCIGTETPRTVPRDVGKLYAPGMESFKVIGGKTAHYHSPIAGTDLDAVYQSVRFDLEGYEITLPEGFYTVTLRFSEVAYNAVRNRVFGVKLEGITAIDALDIYARVGKNAALDVSFEMVRVADGTLNIDFVKQVELPAIAGISVTGEGVAIDINCGGAGTGKFVGDDGSPALEPAVIQELYAGMFKRIMAAHPLDYYWFWTPESWTWEGAQSGQVQNTLADIQLAIAAAREVGAPFTLATCGWVLGPQDDRALFGRALPPGMPVSCINQSVGHAPVEPGFAQIENREKWAIPWLEDDPAMVSPQLWVGRMRRDAYDALRYGCTGLLGIHWRTRILGPNVSALAHAAWDQELWAIDPEGPIRADGGQTTRFDGVDFADTQDDALYQTVRYGMNAYRFAVPEGSYSVVLHLCEPHYDNPGERVFSVAAEGVTAAERLDLFEKAGKNRAVQVHVDGVAVADGVLDVVFTAHTGLAVVSAIEVEGAGIALRVNCGGEAHGAFTADTETLRHLPSGDFYEDWAAASFGKNAASAIAALFTRIDGKLPRPSDWVGGPGGFNPDARPWETVAKEYAFLDELEALHEQVTGAGNLERFDYWLNTFRYMRESDRMRGLWHRSSQATDKAEKATTREEQLQIAREEALPAYCELVACIRDMYTCLLASITTSGGMGNFTNLEQHSMPQILYGPGEKLAALLGEPLPGEALLDQQYRGPDRVFVRTVRTAITANEPLTINATVLSASPPQAVTLHCRALGTESFVELPMGHAARGNYAAALPAESRAGDFEYYVAVTMSEEHNLVWPPTAPALCQTVVVAP